ncbi:MAG: hypothetical protein VX899_24010 [Myxococcota bacterium]|nr:hypothetical protein [Myxococcota bacterium]
MILALLLGCAQPEDTADPCAQRDPALSYHNFGEPFLERYCTSCHGSLLEPSRRFGAPVGVDLDTYADAVLWTERIQARTLDPELPEMPPGGGPTALELERLQEWVDCDLRRAE